MQDWIMLGAGGLSLIVTFIIYHAVARAEAKSRSSMLDEVEEAQKRYLRPRSGDQQ